MSTEPVNYEAVIADLEAKKAQIESAIQAIRLIAGMGTSAGSLGASPSSNSIQSLASDAFLGMTITDATKKLLGMTKKKLSTQDVMKYLEQGGLPPIAYNTAYGVLRRRQNQVGDILNVGGEWALKEWYPNFKPKQRAVKETEDSEVADATEEAVEAVEAEEGTEQVEPNK
jgi:hypothetical protein